MIVYIVTDVASINASQLTFNKAVYTTAPVAGGWAGAVMIWAGAFSNTNSPTLKMPKNAKKGKCERPTDRRTD